MKKIFLALLCFLAILSVACNKNMTKATELSKPDQLMEQVKNDPQFLDYLNSINASMKIIHTNALKGKASDSIVLKDKTKTLEQKFSELKLTGLDSIYRNIEISKQLFASISKKYPLILILNKEEMNVFFKKAHAHFYKIKTN